MCNCLDGDFYAQQSAPRPTYQVCHSGDLHTFATEPCLPLPAAIPNITNPLVFTPEPSSSTLTCTSTGSVATNVTFSRDGTTVGPLRDGESMEFGGVTYQLAQTVTNRAQSTYENVLTINQPLANIIGSTFTCSVENTIGVSPTSQPFIITSEHSVSSV